MINELLCIGIQYTDDVALVGDVIVTLSLAPIQEEAEAGIVCVHLCVQPGCYVFSLTEVKD